MRNGGWRTSLEGTTARVLRPRNRAARRWLTAFVLCCSCHGYSLGAQPVATTSGSPPPIVVVLPDQIELGALVLLAADRLGITVEFDPALIRPAGTQGSMIHFRGDRQLTTTELWEFTTQVLSTRGLVSPQGRGREPLHRRRDAEPRRRRICREQNQRCPAFRCPKDVYDAAAKVLANAIASVKGAEVRWASRRDSNVSCRSTRFALYSASGQPLVCCRTFEQKL